MKLFFSLINFLFKYILDMTEPKEPISVAFFSCMIFLKGCICTSLAKIFRKAYDVRYFLHQSFLFMCEHGDKIFRLAWVIVHNLYKKICSKKYCRKLIHINLSHLHK